MSGSLQGPTFYGQPLDMVNYGGSLQGPTATGAPLDSGFNWNAAAKAFGAGSGSSDGQPVPGTVPNLAPQNAPIPNSPVGRPSQPVNLRDLLTLLMQRQQMYQQAAIGPAGAGGPPQMPARPPGLLGL
jgi:hypothetical protein